jgi:[ribosomal protein S5]-alanine N-acetyltransferase
VSSGREKRVPVRPVPVLRGARVTLRPPVPRDAGAARRIGLHPEILRLFGEQPDGEWRELTRDEAEELLEALAPTEDRVTWVVDAGHGFIGSASLHSFSPDGTTAAYAIGLLDPDVLGRGLGTEVTRLVVAYAFDDLRLRELTVRVLESNVRAIACYARCGFVDLRREPDAVTLDGVSYTDVIMYLESEDYRRLTAASDDGAEKPGPS